MARLGSCQVLVPGQGNVEQIRPFDLDGTFARPDRPRPVRVQPEHGQGHDPACRARTTLGSTWRRTCPAGYRRATAEAFCGRPSARAAGNWRRRAADAQRGVRSSCRPPPGYRALIGVARRAGLLRSERRPDPNTSRSRSAGGPRAGRRGSDAGGRLAPWRARRDNEAVLIDVAQDLGAMPRAIVRRLPDGAAVSELPSVAVEPPFTPSHGDHSSRAWGWVPVRRGPPTRFFIPPPPINHPVIVDVLRWAAPSAGHGGHADVSARPVVGGPGIHRRAGRRSRAHRGGGEIGSVPSRGISAACRSTTKWRRCVWSARSIPNSTWTVLASRGWSFGGYMSALAVLRRPDVFQGGRWPVRRWSIGWTNDTCYNRALPRRAGRRTLAGRLQRRGHF